MENWFKRCHTCIASVANFSTNQLLLFTFFNKDDALLFCLYWDMLFIALLIFESVYFSCACNTLFLTLFLTRVVFYGLPLNFSLLNSKRKGKAIVLIYIRPGWCAHPRYTKTYIYIYMYLCVRTIYVAKYFDLFLLSVWTQTNFIGCMTRHYGHRHFSNSVRFS